MVVLLRADYFILGLIPTEVQVHHGRHAFWLFPQNILQQNGMNGLLNRRLLKAVLNLMSSSCSLIFSGTLLMILMQECLLANPMPEWIIHCCLLYMNSYSSPLSR